MKCDAEKFAQMYEGIYGNLYRFALCMMRDPQDAQDAVSDAVLAAYENIHNLRREDAFRSWMFAILANTCRKKLKASALRQQTECAQSGEEEARAGAEPDYGFSLDVKRAFQILSQEEQEIVAMSVFGGYNSREIGEMFHMNANTVRSKRSRALEKMECVLK